MKIDKIACHVSGHSLCYLQLIMLLLESYGKKSRIMEDTELWKSQKQ